MAESLLVNAAEVSLPDTITAIYTAPTGGQGAVVTAFTAANNSEASASYKAYIYDGTGDVVQAVIPMKIVVRDRYDLGAPIVNQVIPAGGSIRVECSSADALLFTISGREQ